MANKCEEEFNPWPSFVDIFSSVILVMLLFLLVVLVNLGYYAQFKYKVSYTGSITTEDLILNDNPKEIKIQEEIVKESESTTEAETQKQPTPNVQVMQTEIIRLKKIIEERITKSKDKKEAQIESGGIDVKDIKDDDNKSKQATISTDEYFIVTFKGNEIFIDNEITKKLKVFITNTKKKYSNHKIMITAADPKSLASATIAKQVSLARTIGVRNLIRKLDYDKKDVRVDLLASTKIKEKINEDNGYLVIRVKK
ncbi:MAG: hypothetical protein CL623_09895 [Arcobacter sp.]|nr:hypothetical protein [Arcobacter sp.]|tara:strand:+ start:14665 stop:15426 length:762 start_codon:yes stop_codon:yes gene_type:complete